MRCDAVEHATDATTSQSVSSVRLIREFGVISAATREVTEAQHPLVVRWLRGRNMLDFEMFQLLQLLPIERQCRFRINAAFTGVGLQSVHFAYQAPASICPKVPGAPFVQTGT